MSAFRCLRCKRSQRFLWDPVLYQGTSAVRLSPLNTLHKSMTCNPRTFTLEIVAPAGSPAGWRTETSHQGAPLPPVSHYGTEGIPQIPWDSTQSLCFGLWAMFQIKTSAFLFRYWDLVMGRMRQWISRWRAPQTVLAAVPVWQILMLTPVILAAMRCVGSFPVHTCPSEILSHLITICDSIISYRWRN